MALSDYKRAKDRSYMASGRLGRRQDAASGWTDLS